MTHETELSFLDRRARQRQQFKELAILDSDAKDLLAIDRLRRDRGSSTEVGEAIRTTYAQIKQQAPDRKGLFNRIKNAVPRPDLGDLAIGAGLTVAPVVAPALAAPAAFAGLAQLRGGGDITTGAQELVTDVDRPRGAAVGALQGENPLESAKGIAEGAIDPGSKSGRDVGFVRLFSDEDILGPISPRDMGGLAADIAFDPIDLIAGGSLIIGLSKGGRALLRKASKGVPSATRRAVPQTPVAALLDEVLPPRAVPLLTGEVLPAQPLRKVGLDALQRYEGRLNTQGMEIQRDLDLGNQALKELGIGTRVPKGRAIVRSPEMEQLYKALHNESDKATWIARGEDPATWVDIVPPTGWKGPLFDELKRQVDLETTATHNFDRKFMAHPDYFPRGWKSPPGSPAGSGSFAGTPGFVKARNDMTFRELLDDAGLEPRSWNPFEMVALRRHAGSEYREQRELLRHMKDRGVALKAEGPMPDGYRVPRVGAAFEGNILLLQDGQQVLSPRWAIPGDLADIIESQAGVQATLRLGKVDILPPLRAFNNATKRMKLMGSFFQQVDFATRVGSFTTFNGAYEALRVGEPLTAVKRLVSLPESIGKLVFANTSAERRKLLRDQILSGESIWPERPGLSLRGISESGWKTFDASMVDRDIKATMEQIASAPPPGTSLSVIRKVKDRVLEIEQAMQRGLFDGWYPQAQIIFLKNASVPNLLRTHPEWTDQQIMMQAAIDVNTAFSTLGDFQQFAKSPAGKDLLRLTLFSSNETESLVKASFAPFKGDRKAFWAANWTSAALYLGMTAEAVHWAINGEHLPAERFLPLEAGGPLGLKYRSNFLAPVVAKTLGRGGVEISMDLLGQLDTGLRLFEPWAFGKARLSVPVRAAANQIAGSDFFGRPLNTPAERGQQLLSDLGVPIGAGHVLGAAGVGPENEGRLGPIFEAAQATGVNFKAETTPDLLDRKAQERFGKDFDQLEPRERRELDQDEQLQTELDTRRATAVERGNEGAERSLAAEEAREVRQAKQEALDAQFNSGQLSADAWKDARRLGLAELRGALGVIFGDQAGEPETPSQKLAAKVNEFTNEAGQVDWDRVDAWVGTQTAADREFLARNVGLSDTPTEAKYRKALAEAEAAGYFDFSDHTWTDWVKGTAPPEILAFIGRFDTFHDWRQAALAELVAQMGLPEGIGLEQATQRLEQHPVMKAYRDGINRLQQNLISKDPKLATDLSKWGLLSTSENERRFIAGALQ